MEKGQTKVRDLAQYKKNIIQCDIELSVLRGRERTNLNVEIQKNMIRIVFFRNLL